MRFVSTEKTTHIASRASCLDCREWGFQSPLPGLLAI